MSKRKQTTSKQIEQQCNKKNKTSDIEEEYGSCEFWNQRYIDGYKHNWYFNFEQLQPILSQYIPICNIDNDSRIDYLKQNILEIGCGDSPLLPGILKCIHKYPAEIQKQYTLIGMDFSDSIIDSLIKQTEKQHNTNGEFLKNICYNIGDARDMKLIYPTLIKNDTSKTSKAMKSKSNSKCIHEDGFNIILDKGTIDAMLCGDDVENDEGREGSDAEESTSGNMNIMSETSYNNVYNILNEVFRLLTYKPTNDVAYSSIPNAFIWVSHMHPDSDEFQYILSNILTPILSQHSIATHDNNGYCFSIDVHIHTDDCDTYMSADNTCANVYIIEAKARKYRTRYSLVEGMPVSFNVHAYEDDEV